MAKSRTILIVDDSATSLAILFEILDGLGHRVLIAENGEACLRRCRIHRPDLIFMDIALSGIDGIETCQQLKSVPMFAEIPVVFMSARDDQMSRVSCFKAGASAYIPKPVIIDEIACILKNTFSLLDLQEQLRASGRSDINSLGEFDVMVDIIAHDMKSPIVCIAGFAEEISDQFNEFGANDECKEYIDIIRKSTGDIHTVLEALVLLKNLRLRDWDEPIETDLNEIFRNVESRYKRIPFSQKLELCLDLKDLKVLSQPTLFEELVLILFCNFGNLLNEDTELLHLSVVADRNDTDSVLLRLNANTRAIEDTELPLILEPLNGNKRKRVRGTNVQLLCAQKMIAYLVINAWSEHGPNDTLNICLSLKSAS